MAGHSKHGPGFVTCECGKRGYFTRRQARTRGKKAHPGDKLNAYQCEQSGYFHYGHGWPGVRDQARRKREMW